MTTRPAPYARLLLGGLLLVLAGTLVLLARPQDQSQNAATPAVPAPSLTTPAEPRTSAVPTPPPTTAPAAQPPARTAQPRAEGPPSREPDAEPEPVPSGIPVSGDGPGGDHAIQRLLDRTTPADLPPDTQSHLVALATRVWIAETTGTGRGTWPDYFTDTDLRAPYHDVRVQAAVARRTNGHNDEAVVRLVWAGARASGELQDGRPAQVRLALHHNEWEPIR
ncbi:hypothetical protein [Streptomyces sp. WAC01280]|uniref:hypothetical protein n=1 Tax=Streptomyces sp. WAC01280 TaxID=2487424 RepID=UPI00163C7D30|nr:hypothetical protein [Streptomyces sp. WAC01280]